MYFTALSAERIAQCEGVIGYTFKDKSLCAEALNAGANGMATFHGYGHVRRLSKNDRLAVYGDIVACERLCHMWLERELSKGQWTTIRNTVLSNANLANVGFSHGLDTCLVTNPGTVVVSSGMMAAALEAVLGAVTLDGGHVALCAVMRRLGLTHPLIESALFVKAPELPFVDAPPLHHAFEEYCSRVALFAKHVWALCCRPDREHISAFLCEASRVMLPKYVRGSWRFYKRQTRGLYDARTSRVLERRLVV